MSQNNAPPVYAVHLHQKQRNAAASDEIFGAESELDAAFTIMEMARDYGVQPDEYLRTTMDQLHLLREVDAGPCILRLLRSREWYVSEEEPTDDPDEDGTVVFALVDGWAPQVEDRKIILLRLVYEDSE